MIEVFCLLNWVSFFLRETECFNSILFCSDFLNTLHNEIYVEQNVLKKLGNLVSVPKAVTALYVGHPYANYTSKAYFLQHRKDYLVIVGFNFFHLNLVNYTKGMRKLQNAWEKKEKGRRIILIKNRKKKVSWSK